MAGRTLVATFDDVHEARHVVQKLHQDGFAPGWVEHGADGREIAHGSLVEMQNTHRFGRTLIGALLGGLIVMLAVFAVGTVLEAERTIRYGLGLLAGLVGFAIGGYVGRRLDELVSVEVPIERSPRYSDRLRTRDALVTVRVDNEDEEVRALDILRGEATLNRHAFTWRVSLTDAGRHSLT
jgi:hypothetical protein